METKANYVAVGVFTLLLLLAMFGLVWWTNGGGGASDTATLRIRIPGSASGLGRGSAVLFNGVKVGDITRIYIDVQDPKVAIADAQVDELTPITESTRADVSITSLTGQASIELQGGSPNEPNLLALAEENGTVAEITARPSALGNILQSAQSFLTRADEVLQSLEGFVTDVRGPLTTTARNAQAFSEALSKNAENIDTFLASVGKLSETFNDVSDSLGSTLKAAEDLLNSVDREKIETILANVETFTARLEAASGQVDGVMKNVDTAVASITELSRNAAGTLNRLEGTITELSTNASGTLNRLEGTFTKVDGTLDKVDNIVGAVKTEDVQAALANIKAASETARTIADDVANVTDRFGERGDDIDKMISDASELAARLNAASVRVDSVLAKLDGLLGSEDAEGLIADASATFKSFRQVAETLNARMGPITEGLARFSGPGLRDIEALVQDARRSVTRIEETITELGRNPQRILTGGEGTVRQYDGRARR